MKNNGSQQLIIFVGRFQYWMNDMQFMNYRTISQIIDILSELSFDMQNYSIWLTVRLYEV